MHSHLNNHIAREHVNDLLAAAERERLVRAAREDTPRRRRKETRRLFFRSAGSRAAAGVRPDAGQRVC